MNLNVKKFEDGLVKNLIDVKVKKLNVWLSEKSFQTSYGYSVLPLFVKVIKDDDSTDTVKFSELIKMFNAIPYVFVKESRSRRIFQKPMIMSIDVSVTNSYEGHEYFDHTIRPVMKSVDIEFMFKLREIVREKIIEFKSQVDEVINLQDYV